MTNNETLRKYFPVVGAVNTLEAKLPPTSYISVPNNTATSPPSATLFWSEVGLTKKAGCNGLVIMPFASIFGEDVMSNFTFCIQGIQGDYMKYLMQPLNYNFSILGQLGKNFTVNIQGIREFFNKLRNMVTESIRNIFGVFLNNCRLFPHIFAFARVRKSRSVFLLFPE